MLNWLKRAPNPAPPPPEPAPPAPVRELLDRVAALESSQALMRLEWQETLDKITAWANRAAARDRRAVQKALESPENDERAEPDPQVAPANPHAAKAALRRKVFGMR